MNYNLKNTPEYGNFATDETLAEYAIRIEEWFEGFEKELREKFANCASDITELTLLIEEILGDANPL